MSHELPKRPDRRRKYDDAFRANVVAGTYVDPAASRRAFDPSSYLYYPAGTEYHATSPTGCTILVWSTKALLEGVQR